MSQGPKIVFQVVSDPKIKGPGAVVRDKRLLAELPSIKVEPQKLGPMGLWLLQHHQIFTSMLDARLHRDKWRDGLAHAERCHKDGDALAILKWDVRMSDWLITEGGGRSFERKHIADLSNPTHLEAITRAAKANDKASFIRLGRLLEQMEKRVTKSRKEAMRSDHSSSLHEFLFQARISADTDRVSETLFSPVGLFRFESLGLCFFTKSAIWHICRHLRLISNSVSFDTFKRSTLQRLELKSWSPALINQVTVRGNTIFCTSSKVL